LRSRVAFHAQTQQGRAAARGSAALTTTRARLGEMARHAKLTAARLRFALFVSRSYAIIVAENAVERHEIKIDSSAAVVHPVYRTKIACSTAPGIDSNTISMTLHMTISVSGSNGQPAL
jgi:hypothetical protein